LRSAPRLWQGSGLFTADDRDSLVEWFNAAGGSFAVVCFVPTPSSGEAWIVSFAAGPIAASSPQVIVLRLEEVEQYDDGFAVALLFEEIAPGDREWD
jgi:hypothetical protein